MIIKIKKNILNNFFTSSIVLLSLFAFIVRFSFSFLPSFGFDMGAWVAWAARMNELGPAGFYSDTVWTQYTPLILYYLWFLAKAGLANEIVIKITVTLADIATALLARKIIAKKVNPRLSNIAFILYVLSPVTIFVGPVWGQVDGILTLLLLISSYFWIEKREGILSGAFFGLSFLLKPQAFVFLIPALFVGFYRKYSLRKYVKLGAISGIIAFLLSIPFFPENPIFGLPQLLNKMTSHYNFTSVFAFNFWSVPGMWIDDSIVFAGLSYQIWGIILFLISISAIFLQFNKKKLFDYSYLVFALSFFAAFLFPTRVHERYLFPAFVFLLIAAFKNRSKHLLLSYLSLSALSFVNLYHVYAYYSDNHLKSASLLEITSRMHVPIFILSVLFFVSILFFYKRKESNFSFLKPLKLSSFKKKFHKEDSFPKSKLAGKSLSKILLVIIAFSFVTRIAFIGSPDSEYFDEVYHAFTARAMLDGDFHAWDWEGDAPEGFAYEWTHPPVAKLGMMAGMLVFGKNPLGWRLPGVLFGVVSVYLIYAISVELFKDRLLGVFAAGLFSLDGLPLVMSRIGMNDVYLLAFVLFTFYFYIKEKPIYSAVAYGFALASKWSALWAFPLLVIYHIIKGKKLTRRYLGFVILPPLIYMITYIPFFTQGRNFEKFFNINVITKCTNVEPCTESYGLQQQMFWYHTNLKATHSYTSPWWSWPINMRPVYLYTSADDLPKELVSRIYLLGNPIFFWMGLAVIFSTVVFKRNITKNIAVVSLGYLVFFVPWALAPRIMFLYHYLPSIPFLAIIFAYFLRKNLRLAPIVFPILIVTFIYFFPHWTGMIIPKWLDMSYYWFPGWR